ncbi:hypothetical protein [Microbacterium aurum]|uniref:hypothetical protein n=1 Tax=Microbacterium aurum TaxID=36805 RepID=UPI0012F4D194|nr:hypothetical protein [Microbacterium aurum]MBM7826593.1 hypothetical protein [Microbacterium aurum]
MNEEEFDQLLADLVAQPAERSRILADARISETERRRLRELLAVADATWLAAQGAPPLEDDPTAAMLGLVPDRACALDPASFKRARQRANTAPSALAQRLSARGWRYSTADVARWQTHAASVPPALVQAIAEELGVSVDTLIQHVAPAPDRFEAVRQAPRFEHLVSRWARRRRVELPVARSELIGRMTATVHRGQLPEADQVLGALELLVSSLEDDETGER